MLPVLLGGSQHLGPIPLNTPEVRQREWPATLFATMGGRDEAAPSGFRSSFSGRPNLSKSVHELGNLLSPSTEKPAFEA